MRGRNPSAVFRTLYRQEGQPFKRLPLLCTDLAGREPNAINPCHVVASGALMCECSELTKSIFFGQSQRFGRKFDFWNELLLGVQ
jgi:hypothetical protein